MTEVTPPEDSGSINYQPQYQVSPEFRKFWETLFKGADLSDKQVHQLTDQFVESVSDSMNQVLNWAIAQQKQRDQDEQEQDQG